MASTEVVFDPAAAEEWQIKYEVIQDVMRDPDASAASDSMDAEMANGESWQSGAQVRTRHAHIRTHTICTHVHMYTDTNP